MKIRVSLTINLPTVDDDQLSGVIRCATEAYREEAMLDSFCDFITPEDNASITDVAVIAI